MLLNKLNAITVTNVHKNGDLYASKTKKVPFSFEEKHGSCVYKPEMYPPSHISLSGSMSRLSLL